MSKRKRESAAETQEDPVVLVCQGRPACDYEGAGDVEAHMEACVWCARITCHADGTETVREPIQC